MRAFIFGVYLGALFLGLTITMSSCGRGPRGFEGLPGPQGPQGEQGLPGINATPVTMVQLCPGVPTYPTTFIEYAFCVSGQLYATYSANGGFTTYLPPGAYSSNAINSACAFTVSDNCQVTN